MLISRPRNIYTAFSIFRNRYEWIGIKYYRRKSRARRPVGYIISRSQRRASSRIQGRDREDKKPLIPKKPNNSLISCFAAARYCLYMNPVLPSSCGEVTRSRDGPAPRQTTHTRTISKSDAFLSLISEFCHKLFCWGSTRLYVKLLHPFLLWQENKHWSTCWHYLSHSLFKRSTPSLSASCLFLN